MRSSMIKPIQVTTWSFWPDTCITFSVECGQHWTYTLMCAPLSCSTQQTYILLVQYNTIQLSLYQLCNFSNNWYTRAKLLKRQPCNVEYDTSYYWIILTDILSGTASKLLHSIGQITAFESRVHLFSTMFLSYLWNYQRKSYVAKK